MPLLRFPNEILILVAENLSPADINRLHRANQHLYSLLKPMLLEFSVMDQFTTAALYCAAANRDEPMVRFLMEKGKNINVRVRDANRSIGKVESTAPGASAEEFENLVKVVLEKGPNLAIIDRYNPNLQTHRKFQTLQALRWALKHEHMAMFELLLENGADTEHKLDTGMEGTVLHEAAHESNQEACRLLIKHGANVNAVDRWGSTPLFMVTSPYNDPYQGIALLLSKNGGQNFGDNQSQPNDPQQHSWAWDSSY